MTEQTFQVHYRPISRAHYIGDDGALVTIESKRPHGANDEDTADVLAELIARRAGLDFQTLRVTDVTEVTEVRVSTDVPQRVMLDRTESAEQIEARQRDEDRAMRANAVEYYGLVAL